MEKAIFAGNLSQLALLIFALNVISALLFMRLVNRPVCDDPYNISDVHAYATKGVSRATVLARTNPPGPGSFIWMAEAVRLLKGEELLDGRIGALLSWVLLTAGVFFLARYSNFPELWYNICALGQMLWEKRSMVLSTAPVAFALLTIFFFVGEQIGVGGNIPFL